MKNKQSKLKYTTYSKLIDELAKFDQAEPACIIASTDISEPDYGDNFIDGSGVKHVSINMDVVKIVCSDNGKMTWKQLRASLLNKITLNMANKPAIMQICYPDMTDANGNSCDPHFVKTCNVLDEDTIWNIELGPVK